jgi:hypothetical protein
MEADMKKAGIVCALLMGAALLGAQTAPQNVAAAIRSITGRVEIKPPGAAEWQAAKEGQILDKAALISTGFKSTALISLGNSELTVRPLTRLSLEEIVAAGNNEQIVLNMPTGRIRAEVNPPVGGTVDFSVRSPSVTASVRGTVFEFDGIRLTVRQGRVRLRAEGAPGAYVGAGHSTTADPATGRIPRAIEQVKGAMSPSLPAGMAGVSAAPAASPAGADLGITFEWQED